MLVSRLPFKQRLELMTFARNNLPMSMTKLARETGHTFGIIACAFNASPNTPDYVYKAIFQNLSEGWEDRLPKKYIDHVIDTTGKRSDK